MTRIDFYVLSNSDLNAQQHFACRLAEKAVKQGNKVLIATEDAQQSQHMNDYLWQFQPESFVPHSQVGAGESNDVPVVIAHEGDDNLHHDLLINLRKSTPEQFSRFKRLAEIVIQDKTILNASRQSYQFYKSRGYPVNTHKINA